MPHSVPAIPRFLDDSLSELRALTPAAVEQVIAAIEGEAAALPAPLRSTLRIALTTTGLRRVSVLAAAVSLAPRAFSRVCTRAHLPAPKHWLLLAHAIQVSAALNRNPAAPFSDLAEVLGFLTSFRCRAHYSARWAAASYNSAQSTRFIRHRALAAATSIALPQRPERQPA